jgi:hypothetical protein
VRKTFYECNGSERGEMEGVKYGQDVKDATLNRFPVLQLDSSPNNTSKG